MAINIIHKKVTPDDDGIRLDRWFKRYYQQIPFSIIAKLVRTGQIRVGSKRAKVAFRLQADDEIRFPDFESLGVKENYERPKLASPPVGRVKTIAAQLEENIIYLDDNILAINKPAGLAVQGGSKIQVSVDDALDQLRFDKPEKPKLVHRLDKETSGVLLLARNNKTAAALAELFRLKKIDKSYLALLSGTPTPLEGKIDLPIIKASEDGFEKMQADERGKAALTTYRVLDHVDKKISLVELKPITGKTHQLRIHTSLIDCPILGDKKYGRKKFSFENKLYLHAYFLELNFNGQKIRLQAPIPAYFKETTDFLGIKLPKGYLSA